MLYSEPFSSIRTTLDYTEIQQVPGFCPELDSIQDTHYSCAIDKLLLLKTERLKLDID